MKSVPNFYCDDKAWKKILADETLFFKALINKTLKEFEWPDHNISMAVMFTSDDSIQVMNRDFRAKDKPTNVLSFPQIDDFNALETLDGAIELGDIILAYETIIAEAKAQKKSIRDHIAHLIVHGVLHLLGYDHMTKKDADEMEKTEIALLKSVGIKNPY